jgi:hypothetical protein
MKLDCGKRSRPVRRELRIRAKCLWHIWYAWFPVRVGPHDCRWLEPVQRRGTYHENWGEGGDYWIWDYVSSSPITSKTKPSSKK